MKQKMLLVTFLLVGICSSLPAQVETKIPRLRISTSGGLGYLTATGEVNIEGVTNKEKVRQLDNSLRLATHLSGDIHYFFRSGHGIGTKYIFNKTSGEVDEVIIDSSVIPDYPDHPHYMVTDIWERDYTNYLGLSWAFIGNWDKLYLTPSASIGYMWTRSEASMLYQNSLVTGGNVAMNADVSLDYLFHPNWGIGTSLGSFLGFINKVKVTDGTITRKEKLDKESWYNASNIHLSVGLRYYLNR